MYTAYNINLVDIVDSIMLKPRRNKKMNIVTFYDIASRLMDSSVAPFVVSTNESAELFEALNSYLLKHYKRASEVTFKKKKVMIRGARMELFQIFTYSVWYHNHHKVRYAKLIKSLFL